MMRRSALVLLSTLAACPERTSTVHLGGRYAVVADIAPTENLDIDVLFVIDNSGSMGDNQAALAAAAQDALFAVLESEAGVMPNLHVGVVSTNVGAGGYPITTCGGEGENGRLQYTPRAACAGPAGAFIVDVAAPGGERERNYVGTIGETFACIARLGTEGCGFERPFDAMRRALDGSNPENAGFLRPEALLVVVIVTDEDDCSAHDRGIYDPDRDRDAELGPLSSFRCHEFGVVCDDDADPRAAGPRHGCRPREDSAYIRPVQEYVDFLVGVKGDPTKVLVVGIAGTPEPVTVLTNCVSYSPTLAAVCADNGCGEFYPPDAGPPGPPDAAVPPPPADAGPPAPPPPPVPDIAYPAVRLHALLDAFPARSAFSPICSGDMGEALARTAQLTAGVATRRPCLVGAIRDGDDTAPGVQPSCRVYDAVAPRTPDERRTELPSCAATGGAAPCATIVADEPACSGTETGLAVRVTRAGEPPPGAHVVVECLAPAPDPSL